MIKLNNVSKTYKSIKGNEYAALKNINLEFNNTGMVFITGKSGSGKTTLLNILGGLDKPDEGYLVINRKSTNEFNEKDYDCYRNTNIGFIFQEFNLIESLNVEENVMFSSELLNEEIDKNKVDRILKLVGLEGLNKRNINELSGGQRQRVAIARILNKDCDYILADEPTGNLDTKAGKQIFDILKKLSKSKLVIIVSHDKENAKKYADRIIEIKNGEVNSDITRIKEDIKDDFFLNDKGEVYIPSSRPLTEKEIKKLNGLLNEDIKEIKSIPKQFKKTRPIEVEDNKKFNNKIPKMSLRNTLKFALHNIKVKKGRFVTIISILVIALTILGFSSFFSEFDGKVATVNTFKANSIEKIIINHGRYNQKIQRLENKKIVFTDKEFINEFEEKIGDNYLESRNILIHRQRENTLAQSLTDIENGFQISEETDLNKMDFNILKGTFKKNTKDLGYVNLMITDYTWYIHSSVESTFLTQTLNSNTVENFKEFLGEEIENLDEDTKTIINNLIRKLDSSNGSVTQLSNTEKMKIFNTFKDSEKLMEFVLNYFESNFSWESSNVLYKITAIINTGMSENEKQIIDSIIDKNDNTLLTDDEERLISRIRMYYNKVYGDLIEISGVRDIHLYSRSGTRITLMNNINDNLIYPTSYAIVSYSYYNKYNNTTHFIGANAGKNLVLRNGYSIGSITDKNNYKILAPIEPVQVQRPSLEDKKLNSNKIPNFPVAQIRKTGLQNNDVILDKDIFSSLFGSEAIDKYFLSPTEDDEKVDLIVKFKLTEGAEPIEFRVVGIANGGGIAIMMGDDSLNTIMLNNNVYDSYLINLSNNTNTNVKLLELLEKHDCFHVSEVSSIMYQTISVFNVFKFVFMTLTIVLIILVIILTSNFIKTSITRKTKEIGLLRALGATKKNVNRIFLFESLLIGFISSGLSVLISILAVTPINKLVLLSLPEFFGTELSIEISLLSFNIWMVPVFITISLITCIISTILPAYRIGKIKPSESMRTINK